MQTWTRRAWDAEAAAALGDLIPAEGTVAEDVAAGRLEVYRITGADADGWLLLQVADDELILIAGRGRGMAAVIPVLIRAARQTGCRRIMTRSFRRGYERFVRRMGFRRIPGGTPGEPRFCYVLQ